ncbi:PAS domain-containing protein [Agrobacterium sp. Azo12]|uniref:PAS domain-containing protein n=1 Tax=Agrobacterium sp. Azo12 TaxID=3031129 RepID=UPI0023D86F83|nr:PAS domain-containing protein [Agrobacterium sp. Azo12]MDO5897208.1 PAS domain-containing protein [Agrobacterium sp. Azo12]
MDSFETTFHAEVEDDDPAEIGFFTWDLSENSLRADAALAALFGLDAEDAANGLPIEVYLKRVHPEDRPSLAKTIRDSIIANRPQQQTYRVCNPSNEYTLVTGYGRGFRDRNGDTVTYVGIVIPALSSGEAFRPH